MKRAIVAALLAGFMLSGIATGAAPPDPIGLVEDIRTPPKRIVTQGYYRRIGSTDRYLFLCEASAFGGAAVLTRINKCTVTGSNGGSATGVTPAIIPGLEAVTVGVGGFDPGVFTACITASALFADGTSVSVSGCDSAILLRQGYI
jgi:hypothetical protein